MPKIKTTVEIGKTCKECKFLKISIGILSPNLFCILFGKSLYAHIGWDSDDELNKMSDYLSLDDSQVEIIKCNQCIKVCKEGKK